MKYELHPLCTFFPRMFGAEFDALRDDIKENGLKQPIVIYDGMILDGGNRYKACIESGVEPVFIEYDGDNIASFVLSMNMHRRHLSQGQYAAIVSSMQNWEQSHPSIKLSKDGCNVAPLSTVANRAAKSGASIRTQQMADKVAKTDPELAKKVACGEISLPSAVKQINPKKGKDKEKNNQPDQSELQKQLEETDQLNLELSHEIASLDEENKKLRDAIATNQLPATEIQSAEEIIKELREENANLKRELQSVKDSRDSYMRELATYKDQCNRQAKQLKRMGVANNA